MLKLGIDLGGTNIAVGVVDQNHKIISRAKCKTNLPRSAEDISDDILKISQSALQKAGLTLDDISSVGIGTPGALNPETGIIAYSANFNFYNVNLKKLIEERFLKKVYIENDANAAAYGEFIAGAGKGSNNFVMITIGTGIGGGLIINKKIYSGSNGAGGEIGHTVLCFDGEECNCGRNGCFEAYASASALVRQTKKAMQNDKDSLMWQLCGDDLSAVDGFTSFDAMRKGDCTAKLVVKKYLDYLSAGITNTVNTFQPDIVCIGGGLSHEGETVLKPVEEFVNREDYARNMSKKTKIKAAMLGNDAGIIGAAFLDGVI